MMIADEQQQDEQPEGAMVLGEDFQPTPLVNTDGSEDLLATHITREKKTLFFVPVGVQDRTLWLYMTQVRVLTSYRNEIMKPFPSRLLCPLQEG